jgi:transketolase
MNHLNKGELTRLRIRAEVVRKNILRIIFNSRSGHTGGSLSSTDILATLYFSVLNSDPENPKMDNRDRFILSKGHSAESYYCVLAEAGFISYNTLYSYGSFGSPLAGHPTVNVPGVEVCSGALGHGLSIGVGMALAAKLDQKPFKVYVLMGDGEQAEGSIHEAAMSARHYKLDNLIAIIDRNKLQISGCTEDVMSIEPIEERWSSMGWDVVKTDGNNVELLLHTFTKLPLKNEKPCLIIANTIKGKGVSFMEGKAAWHHKVPTEEQYQNALDEINERISSLSQLLPKVNEQKTLQGDFH